MNREEYTNEQLRAEIERLRARIASLEQAAPHTQEPGEGRADNQALRQEIDARRQADRVVRRTATLYHSIIENLPQHIFCKDREGRFILANRRFCETLGKSLDQVIGRTDADFYPADLAQKYRADDLQVINTGGILDLEEAHQLPGGERIYVRVVKSPLYDARRQIIGVQGIFWDVTEARRSQEALQRSLSLLRATIESTADGLLVVDLSGNVAAYNQKFVRLWGIPEDVLASGKDQELIRFVLDQLADPEAFVARVQALYARPSLEDYDILLFKDGRVIERYSQPQWLGDEIAGRVWSFRDVTERRRLQSAEHGQRMLAEALRDTAATLNSTLELDEVLKRILANVGRVVPHDAANIMLIEGDVARIVRSQGYTVRGVDPALLEMPFVVIEHPHLRHMFSSGESWVMQKKPNADLPGESAGFPPAWVGSSAGAPIRMKGKVIGFVNLDSMTPGFYTQEHARRLQAFADQAAVAIDNARLYDAMWRFATDREEHAIQRTQELLQEKERIEAILNSSSDAILLFGADGTLLQNNPAFARMFRCESDEVTGRSITSLFTAEHTAALLEALREVIEDNRPQQLEVRACRQDNSSFDAEAMLSPIKDVHTGQIWGVVCILRDITARKRAEATLREALNREKELGELKSRFVSMISHEFRTPLTTILSSAELLRRHLEQLTADRRREHLDKIKDSVRYMTQMLEEVLMLGRIDVGRLKIKRVPVDLFALTQDIIEAVQVELGTAAPVELFSEEQCTDMLLDPNLIRHVLTNLLSNAIKYSPDGSPVRVELHCGDEAAILRVHDNGIGIPRRDQAFIFEPFHRARNVGTIRGTGLGLSIARHAITLHNGTITFESEPDRGTTFTVTIPATSPDEQPSAAESDPD